MTVVKKKQDEKLLRTYTYIVFFFFSLLPFYYLFHFLTRGNRKRDNIALFGLFWHLQPDPALLLPGCSGFVFASG